ncbi:MAG: hypothetical protein WC501_04595 [Candidatus Micrarchaeia archaeon]
MRYTVTGYLNTGWTVRKHEFRIETGGENIKIRRIEGDIEYNIGLKNGKEIGDFPASPVTLSVSSRIIGEGYIHSEATFGHHRGHDQAL